MKENENGKQLSEAKWTLHRPDTFVGSLDIEDVEQWVLEDPNWTPPIIVKEETPTPTNAKKEDKDEKKEETIKNELLIPSSPNVLTETPSIDTASITIKNEMVTPPNTPLNTPQNTPLSTSNSPFSSPQFSMPKTAKKEEKIARIIYKNIKHSSALGKIFDEVLTNASDQHKRFPKKCTTIHVVFEKNGEISVKNNGPGISSDKGEDGQYNVVRCFESFRYSTNFEDNKERIVGGKNGLGVKISNVFATNFIVETLNDKEYFKQRWTNNMESKDKPVIIKKKDLDNKDQYTKITWTPDYKRLNFKNGLTDDMKSLLCRRVFDIAASNPKLSVFLNAQGMGPEHKNGGHKIQLKNLKEYASLFLPDDHENPVLFEQPNNEWSVALTTTENDGFSQVSFVNGVQTTEGGKHVDHVLNPIVKHIQEELSKKLKDPNEFKKVTPTVIKNHLFLFVNCTVVDPKFHNQMKTKLTTAESEFTSKCKFTDKFLRKITKETDIIKNIVDLIQQKAIERLSKTDGSKKTSVVVDKYEGASAAGGKESHKCTLVLTEGDSAKGLIMPGLSVVGRKYYGVFPLKGKVVNPRDAKIDKIEKNNEFKNIKKILGLKQKETYDTEESRKTLRYGHVMIAADQDTDGFHIKALVANIFSKYWENLFHSDNFLSQFRTPVIKLPHKKDKKLSLSFYNVEAWKKWKEMNPDYLKTWNKEKYYKGLGTSTAKEGKEYFQDLPKHQVKFKYEGKEDDKNMDMIFNKKKADQRKTWLASFSSNTDMETTTMNEENNNKNESKEVGKKEGADIGSINYTNFINKELILFGMEANQRAIPSVIDGLKPGQRKILYTMFKFNCRKEIKVSALTGKVTEHAAYHHGEMSLHKTIIKMAQNFVGSNNVNLLEPEGIFGSRDENGEDFASPRYINTFLSPVTDKIFVKEDEPLLNYLMDDGAQIEPDVYLPVIPFVLLNGTSGIGMGWSTDGVWSNPFNLIDIIRSLLQNDNKKELVSSWVPWVRRYKGKFELNKNKNGWIGKGIVVANDEQKTFTIKEVEIGKNLSDYRTKFLLKLKEDGKILDMKNQSPDENNIKYVISCSSEQYKKIKNDDINKFFKVDTNISLTNMVFFNPRGKLQRYKTVQEIILEFYQFRLPFFQKRKDYQIADIKKEMVVIDNKVRFIKMVVEEKLVIRNVPKKIILEKLIEHKFDPVFANEKNDDENEEEKDTKQGYQYLMNMALWSLTKEKIEQLEKLQQKKSQELKHLEETTIQQMWLNDLDQLEKTIQSYEAEKLLEESNNSDDKSSRILSNNNKKRKEIVGKKDIVGKKLKK